MGYGELLMPSCTSDHLCKEFTTAVHKVVDQAAHIHTHTIADGEGYCDMPNSCGPTGWAILHGTVAALRDTVCSHCGEEAVKLVSFLHDLVNTKLGKPRYDDANYKEILQLIRDVESGVSVAHQAQEEKCNMDFLNMPNVQSLPLDHEVGAPICQGAAGPYLGAFASGDHNNVDIPLRCSGADPLLGTFHTHPGGIAEPSHQDLLAAHANNYGLLCVAVPDTGEMVCQRL